ncbi:MAG: Hsp20/alpha crystallin family protein [Microvirga sp.]
MVRGPLSPFRIEGLKGGFPRHHGPDTDEPRTRWRRRHVGASFGRERDRPSAEDLCAESRVSRRTSSSSAAGRHPGEPGEKKFKRTDEDKNFYYIERSYGTFQLPFRLPGTFDPDQVQARLEHGVPNRDRPEERITGALTAY